MAGARWEDTGVLEEIIDSPWEWDFFQALREIERTHPEMPRLGTSTTVLDDPVRFGQFVSLAFATSTMERQHSETRPKVEGTDRLEPASKVLVRFMGLTGPDGPLPLVLTELIRNRLVGVDDPDLPRTYFGEGADRPQAARRDPALAEFIDLFHHRLICLFYRAWAMANKTVDFERHHLPDGQPCFSRWIASLFGHGLPEYDGLDSIPTWQKLAFAGHLSNPTRHLSGLRGVISAAFTATTEVDTLVGHWVNIPPKEQCRLGESRRTGTVGDGCMIGSCYWDREQKFGVRLGPVPYQEFITFLPGQENERLLRDWIDLYTRREFNWEAAIVLRREDVPPLVLGGEGALGWTAWLTCGALEYDPDDYTVAAPEL